MAIKVLKHFGSYNDAEKAEDIIVIYSRKGKVRKGGTFLKKCQFDIVVTACCGEKLTRLKIKSQLKVEKTLLLGF